MSRNIARRLIVTGQLHCLTPLHVGGGGDRAGVDLALSVNGAGEIYVPGTSLAGPLRAWCREMFGPEDTNALWGPPGDHEVGHASFINIEDLALPEDAISPEIRDGVGIDRYSATAANDAKFNREILPATTKLSLQLIFEEQAGNRRGADLLAGLLQALAHGEIRFGASKSRGLGRVALSELAVVEQDLSTKAGILTALRKASPTFRADEALCCVCPEWREQRRSPASIEIRIAWRPVGPLMVKAGVDGIIVDTLPLLSGTDGGLGLVLPGSSSKGALRSQAERILSTVLGSDVGEETTFLKQLARHPIIETLFGASNRAPEDVEKDRRRVGLSPLSIDDCFSVSTLTPATSRHLLGEAGREGQTNRLGRDDLSAWTDALPEHKKGDGSAYLDPAPHVAIDRWAGGASDGALFSVLEPWGFEWPALVLALDPLRLARRHDDGCADEMTTALAGIALLLLTLRDFANGKVPLGFGTTRGFGSVSVSEIDVSVPAPEHYHDPFVRTLLEALRPLDGRLDVGSGFRVDEAAERTLKAAWSQYPAAQPKQTATQAVGVPA